MKRKHFWPESVDIAYDQNYVYLGCDGTVMKFNLFGAKPLLKYFESECGIRKIAASDKFIAAASNDGILRIYRKNGDLLRHIEVSNFQIMDVKIAKDESFIVCGSSDGTVNCWSLLTGEKRFSNRAHKSMIWSLCLANNDTLIVSGATDGLINFINAGTGEIILQMFNLKKDKDILVSVPHDKNFPNGYFYTSNKDFIDVYDKNVDGNFDLLENNVNRRLAYINKLNCKNLILNRIKPTSQYDTLLSNFFNNHHTRTELRFRNLPKSLEQNQNNGL